MGRCPFSLLLLVAAVFSFSSSFAADIIPPAAELAASDETSPPVGDEKVEKKPFTQEELEKAIEDLKQRIDDLEADASSLQDSIEAVTEAPDESLRVLRNFVIAGSAYSIYSIQDGQDGTFWTFLDPWILFRYGDRMLVELHFDMALSQCLSEINVAVATFNYIINDCWTIRGGQFFMPLGFVWEKLTSAWITKLPTLPLPYVPLEMKNITPGTGMGIDLRGAIPFNWLQAQCCSLLPIVFVYDFWVVNGPGEDQGTISLNCGQFDNNRTPSVGSRLALRFEPYREIGVSGQWGQWNNNGRGADPVDPGAVSALNNQYYSAAVLDLHWRLGDYSELLGEFIYTSFDATPNPDVGINGDFVKQIGGWIQYSVYPFADCCCICPRWKNFEAVARYGFVNSDIEDATGKQISFGINYHYESAFVFKVGYDINWLERIPGNVFTAQLAYCY